MPKMHHLRKMWMMDRLPSCCGKRMAEIASHLVDNIIPLIPVRQYVLTVPIALRYWMASNKELCSAPPLHSRRLRLGNDEG